jgi:hypothetical protein
MAEELPLLAGVFSLGILLACLAFCWQRYREAEHYRSEAACETQAREQAEARLDGISREMLAEILGIFEAGVSGAWLANLVSELRALEAIASFLHHFPDGLQLACIRPDHNDLYTFAKKADEGIAPILEAYGDAFVLVDCRSGIESPIARFCLNQQVNEKGVAVFRVTKAIDAGVVESLKTLAAKQDQSTGLTQYRIRPVREPAGLDQPSLATTHQTLSQVFAFTSGLDRQEMQLDEQDN